MDHVTSCITLSTFYVSCIKQRGYRGDISRRIIWNQFIPGKGSKTPQVSKDSTNVYQWNRAPWCVKILLFWVFLSFSFFASGVFGFSIFLPGSVLSLFLKPFYLFNQPPDWGVSREKKAGRQSAGRSRERRIGDFRERGWGSAVETRMRAF